jgi:hypothetical protein
MFTSCLGILGVINKAIILESISAGRALSLALMDTGKRRTYGENHPFGMC